MKNLSTNEEDGKKNRKIIDIIDEKTFQPRLRTKKEKPRLVEGKETCSKRELIKKGLNQNKMLCSSFMELNC